MNQFKGRKLIIATMHGKEKIIAPILKKHLGVQIIVPKDFNSDEFGTFTKDIKRKGNQIEAARAKLKKAMDYYKVDLGISSEGSFGPDVSIPFIQSNLELIILIDTKNNYEIFGYHKTLETNISEKTINSLKEALEFCEKIGFPEHGIILKVNKKNTQEIYKNINTKNDLINLLNKLLFDDNFNKIYIETDMRAYKNPTRMKAIKKAAEDLVKNIKSNCVNCNTPGFMITDTEKGLICSICNKSTELVKNYIYKCKKCEYCEKRPNTQYGDKADPQYCLNCNP